MNCGRLTVVLVFVLGCGSEGDSSGVMCDPGSTFSDVYTVTETFTGGDSSCTSASVDRGVHVFDPDRNDSFWDCFLDSESFSNDFCTRQRVTNCFDPAEPTRRAYQVTSTLTQRDSQADFFDGTRQFRLDAFTDGTTQYPACTASFNVTWERE